MLFPPFQPPMGTLDPAMGNACPESGFTNLSQMGTLDPAMGKYNPDAQITSESNPPPMGKPDPAMGKNNPDRVRVAIDWSHKGLHITYADGTQELIQGGSGTLRAWLTTHPLADVAIEPTFESFNLGERAKVIAEHGHRMFKVPSRWTEGQRRAQKLDKSDFTDSGVIFSAWDSGIHMAQVKAYAPVNRDWQLDIIINRASGWPEENPPQLPDPKTIKDVPWLKQTVLANGKRYRDSFVWPLIIAAQNSKTRGEYDRFIGAYGHGYPSVLRSNFYHHRVRSGSKEDGYNRKEAMRLHRRATRWVYYHVKRAA